MSAIRPLPRIMVAPNGARRGKADHPALPITIAETVATARACFAAGADGLHAHVRDHAGTHVLDAGLYRELIAEMALHVPGMSVQITTEAVGRYSPDAQRALVTAVRPSAVSIGLNEMVPAHYDRNVISRFYKTLHARGTSVQHILYHPDELTRFARLVRDNVLPDQPHQLLFVLGRHVHNLQSHPDDLKPFLTLLKATGLDQSSEWAVCAFGVRETECLVYGAARGGKLRVGFENNLYHTDGMIAADNADRIRHLLTALGAARQ